MGMIYQAHDPLIDRKIAIKLIRADLLDGEERAEYLTRFQREAQAAGRCAHPNIVAIYDFAVHEGNPYLAMEYVEGRNLGQVLSQSGRFSSTDAVVVMGQVLDALGCAHGLGVVHRDVKPANILVQSDQRVKMTDFGISRLDMSALTQAGSIIGTPSYMSPEQCRGEAVDARSDLFSVGVVLYELLSGSRPFTGRNMTEVALQVMNQPPPDLRLTRPDLSPSLITVIERSLAKQPDSRYPSASEMAASLRRAVQFVHDEPGDRTFVVAHQHSRLRHDMTGSTPAASTQRVLTAISQQAERELATYLGPIARILVKRTLEVATSADDFWRRLSMHIERDADRASFLKKHRQ